MFRPSKGRTTVGCNCGGSGQSAKLSWSVDLAGTGRVFGDGTTKKTYALVGDANSAIAQLGLTGTIVPKPVTV
jgi:hypothetical protein